MDSPHWPGPKLPKRAELNQKKAIHNRFPRFMAVFVFGVLAPNRIMVDRLSRADQNESLLR